MAIAAGSPGMADANERTPSAASVHALDAVNLFLAAALAGFGPYVAAYLASQNWTQQNIGFILSAAGLGGLMSQILAGELLDTIRSKRAAVVLGAFMIAAAALTIALWPAFPVVFAALALQAISGGFLGLAVAAR